ncbi:MAG: hypothetical protein AB7F75_03975 [Planctomycetota bacterium]
MTMHLSQLSPVESSVVRLMRQDKKFQALALQVFENYRHTKPGEPSVDALLESVTGVDMTPFEDEGNDGEV